MRQRQRLKPCLRLTTCRSLEPGDLDRREAARGRVGERDDMVSVLLVIAFLEARRAADEIADRARRQSELGEEPDGGTGRDHLGEVLLGMGGDQYHW
jgi:hypothetical protein